MDGSITSDLLMKEPSAQVQHATNDFCIAPRLAESGAHSMDGLITPDSSMRGGARNNFSFPFWLLLSLLAPGSTLL